MLAASDVVVLAVGKSTEQAASDSGDADRTKHRQHWPGK